MSFMLIFTMKMLFPNLSIKRTRINESNVLASHLNFSSAESVQAKYALLDVTNFEVPILKSSFLMKDLSSCAISMSVSNEEKRDIHR